MCYKLGSSVEGQAFSVHLCLQGYTLADEEEDPLIYQHRMLRSNQGDALASGPVETGPMKKLHVSTINLQKAGPSSPGRVGSRLWFSFKTVSYHLEFTPANPLVFEQCPPRPGSGQRTPWLALPCSFASFIFLCCCSVTGSHFAAVASPELTM